jgi:hypothetical protein
MSILKSLEEYILQQYLGEQAIKRVEDIHNLDPDHSLGTMISYQIRGKTYRLRRPMYLASIYADLIRKGYLCAPIRGGWLVYGGTDTYQIPATVDVCTCKDYIYKHQQGKVNHKCQHLLMVLALLDTRSRVARLIEANNWSDDTST